MDTSVNLKLGQDTYVLKHLQKRTSSSHEPVSYTHLTLPTMAVV